MREVISIHIGQAGIQVRAPAPAPRPLPAPPLPPRLPRAAPEPRPRAAPRAVSALTARAWPPMATGLT